MVQKFPGIPEKARKRNTSKGITFFPKAIHRNEPFHLNSPRNYRVFRTNGKRSWIAENFNFSVFEVFCLSSSWKYRFSQNVNHTKVQSKTNKCCKFHVDLTRRRLPKSQFKKLGMVPKKLYRNTLSSESKEAFFEAYTD